MIRGMLSEFEKQADSDKGRIGTDQSCSVETVNGLQCASNVLQDGMM